MPITSDDLMDMAEEEMLHGAEPQGISRPSLGLTNGSEIRGLAVEVRACRRLLQEVCAWPARDDREQL